MANTFDALMAEVNQKISQAMTATSEANAAAAQANAAAQSATEQAQQAQTAAQQAHSAAQQAGEEAQSWEGAVVQAKTAAALSDADVSLTEEGGVKKLSFVIPRGENGAQGPKGDTGRSGVTFSVSGSKLYITTG